MERAAVEDLRHVIKERLTVAAEEIFGAFRTTISVYEEELHRHRKLLDVLLQPQIKLQRIDLPQQDISKGNQQPSNQNQENTESARVKEEPWESCSSLEGEWIALKREDDSKSTCEHSQVQPPLFSGERASKRLREAKKTSCVSDARKTSESYNKTEANRDHGLLIHTSPGANNQYGRNVSHSNNTVPEDKEKGSFPSSYNMRGPNDEDQQMQVLANRAWTANHQPKLLEKHFRCSRCSQDFDSKTQLDLHMKTHTGQMPSTPTAHGSQFGLRHYFAQTVTQSAEESHACMRCGETFPHEQALQMHMTHHPGCSFGEEKEGLAEQPHIDQQDKGEEPEELCSSLEEKPFALKQEDDSLSSFQSISGHHSEIWPPAWNSCQSQREVENNFTDSFNVRFGFEGNSCGVPEKPHKCSICGESYDLPSQLQSHVTVHATERPFSCSVCGRRFSVKGYLTKHMKTHSGVKPHPCGRCGKTFRRLEHLRTHMRGHTGEKLYSCQFCGKEFAYQTSYTYHIRVHTGEKPFECSLCGKKFAVGASLTAHTRKHTGEKPYVCQICGKAFAINTALKMHIKTHMREVEVSPLEENVDSTV